MRERIFAATGEAPGQRPDLAASVRAVWRRTSDPRREAEFRLFFEVYGRALQAPQQFAGFLDRVVADWMSTLIAAQGPVTGTGSGTRPRVSSPASNRQHRPGRPQARSARPRILRMA